MIFLSSEYYLFPCLPALVCVGKCFALAARLSQLIFVENNTTLSARDCLLLRPRRFHVLYILFPIHIHEFLIKRILACKPTPSHIKNSQK